MGGSYKQFVANRIKKILEKGYIQWRYVPTNENKADIASRGGDDKELGKNGAKVPAGYQHQQIGLWTFSPKQLEIQNQKQN